MICPHCGVDVRRSVVGEYQGEPVSLRQLAKRTGIAYATLAARYRNGHRGELLTRPVDPKYNRRGNWGDL